jgi:uncharacterized protein (TIGR02246 family)
MELPLTGRSVTAKAISVATVVRINAMHTTGLPPVDCYNQLSGKENPSLAGDASPNCAKTGFDAEFVACGRLRIVVTTKEVGLSMRCIAPALVVFAGLAVPAAAQKAEIAAANAKWMDFFNKGDFDGVASLYTADATALPPGSAMVKGRAAIGAMWNGMADQMTDPKITTIDVKRLGPAAAREIGTFSLKTKSSPPKEVTGKYVVVWEKVGRDWKLANDIWNEGK